MLHPGVGRPAVRAMEPSATSPYTMERQGGLLSLLCGMSALGTNPQYRCAPPTSDDCGEADLMRAH